MAATNLPFAPTGAPNLGYGLNVGFPTSGTPNATGGIPGMSGLLVNTNVRPTSAFGTQSFTSVMAHYVCISNPSPKDPQSVQNTRDLSLGMMVFARETDSYKNASKPNRVLPRYDGVSVGPNTAEFKELTQLNEYLLVHSDDYDSAAAVLAEWRLMGVIKNETAPTNAAYGQGRVSRVLNMVVSHRVSMLNYWVSCKVLPTQKLYLIVHKSDTQPKVNGKQVWQVTPWSSPDAEYPPLTDELMTSKDGTPGAVLYVGRSSDQAWGQYGSLLATKTEFSSSLVKRGLMQQLEVYLGI
jgi:hypothetical protein